jgi:acetyltransferase-like isoleucine patch superfamily enzyme
MIILKILLLFIPWKIRRILLIKIFNFEIHSTASIGFSFIYPKTLIMKEFSSISHFNVAINLEKIEIGPNSTISRSNWITGFPKHSNSLHFNHEINRNSFLIIGCHSAITKNHHLDCTNTIQIGNFVTVAGYQSQFLTHSVNIYNNRQESFPITIGNYCFVGTNTTILGGSFLPECSVLGAKSLLNKVFNDKYKLYAGVPAKEIMDLPENAKYFKRKVGFVV